MAVFSSSIRRRNELWNATWQMKVREIIKLIEADGWRQVAQRGSHRQYKHVIKAGKVTISGAPSDDIHPKTLSSVLKQAGLKQS